MKSTTQMWSISIIIIIRSYTLHTKITIVMRDLSVKLKIFNLDKYVHQEHTI